MIKIERAQVMNLENALRGMRNPMDSWDKSDSGDWGHGLEIGPNDLHLARSLVKSGSDHRKFLRQIFVSVDVTAPLYWWKEYDTYKVGTVANSTSTMHTIHTKPFSREAFSCERMSRSALECLDNTIKLLEIARQDYNRHKTAQAWDDMIQLLPSSFNQLRTCTLTFENLLNIYRARKAHKLQEWRQLCGWAANDLPHFAELCLTENLPANFWK